MKNLVIFGLLAACLVVCGLLWKRVGALENAAAQADYPLGENMGYLQRYADKLWYAGQAGNWDLAKFYAGEIRETADGIMAANITKDNIVISPVMQKMLVPTLKPLDDAVAARDLTQFTRAYQVTIAGCNACHQNTKHVFIHILTPAGPASARWNQDFAPQP